MKFDYGLTFSAVQNGNFENQLKQFCNDNKFLFTGMKWNSFSDNSHTLWTSVYWTKNKKYPNGEFVRFPDGTVKKDKESLLSRLRIFPASISLNDAKELLAFEVLHELYGYTTYQRPPPPEDPIQPPPAPPVQ